MTSLLTHSARPRRHNTGCCGSRFKMIGCCRPGLYPMPLVMRVLDFCGIVGASTLVWTGLRCLQSTAGIPTTPPGRHFLTGDIRWIADSAFDLHTAERYLHRRLHPVGIANHCREAARLRAAQSCVGVVRRLFNHTHLVTGPWMRGEYSVQQAAWKSADTLVHAGVQPDNIYGSDQWAAYHGAFDAWIAAGVPGFVSAAGQPANL